MAIYTVSFSTSATPEALVSADNPKAAMQKYLSTMTKALKGINPRWERFQTYTNEHGRTESQIPVWFSRERYSYTLYAIETPVIS